MTGRHNFGQGQISNNPKRAVKSTVGAYRNTDEFKLANSLVRALNVAAINERTFAYHFVQRAPGVVIKNLFKLFDGVLDVLAERFDNDACSDTDEYDCAVIAKRIQDALGKYNP